MAQGRRTFSGTCDRLTSVGEQLKSRFGESLSDARGQLRHGSEGKRMGNYWLSYFPLIVKQYILPRKLC
jgi:hypothetical protein